MSKGRRFSYSAAVLALVAVVGLSVSVPARSAEPSRHNPFQVASSQDLLLAPAPAKGGNDLLAPAPAKGGNDLLAPAPASGGNGLLAPAPSGGGTNLLLEPSAPAGLAAPTDKGNKLQQEEVNKEHEKLFLEKRYPSANTCATCHPKQYREWSVSQHAYAQLSPVYMSFQATINQLTSGTNGDFCIRCHNQVGMNLGESIYVTNLKRNPTSREGITCVVCHRINKNYGKVSGRLALVEGDIYSTVFGPTGGKELQRVLNTPTKYRVSASRDKPGRAIHAKIQKFFELTKPGFCGTCHDVTLLNGFKLEEAFSEYKQSPAAKKGVTCQDCHMGKVQGIASGYEQGPAAMVGGVPTRTRKLTNHFFAGPDYSVVHPGIFPHNVEAAQLKTLGEWLQFDYKAGWGTDAFENHIPKDYKFPAAWQSIDDRYDARAILKEQFARLEYARKERLEVLRNGIGLSDIRVTKDDKDGLDFEIDVKNLTDGHAIPTGFDAERLMYLDVTVTDADGKIVFRSGDRDPNGDVRDQHSLYVHNGDLPRDTQLFNLQSKFLVRPVQGAEREKVLAVNLSATAQPFIRPEARPTTLYGRPRGARKHKETIEPLGHRTAHYTVSGDKLDGHGPYKVDVKFIAQMIPVNLVAAIAGVGFDYSLSPKEIAERVVAGAQTIAEKTATVGGKPMMEHMGKPMKGADNSTPNTGPEVASRQ